MKIQSRDIPHKSEIGGVRINVANAVEATATYDELRDRYNLGDDPFNPRTGVNGSLTEMISLPAFGSNFKFTQSTLNIVTTLSSREKPRSTWSGSQGLSSSFSARHN